MKVSTITGSFTSATNDSPPCQIQRMSSKSPVDWLNELRELHYVPYNSCTSLTIYSYKHWPSENRILIATKANNLKEFNFKTVTSNSDTNLLDNFDLTLSNRSSVSSNNSNPISTNFSANKENLNSTNNASLLQEAFGKNQTIVNSTVVEEKAGFGANVDFAYLDPNVKIHQLSKIKNESLISTIDVFDLDNFSVFVVCFVLKSKPDEQFFVQIYSDFETSNLSLILECCQEFKLDNLPHRVTNLLYLRYDSDSQTKQKSERFIQVNCAKKNNVHFLIDVKNRKFERVSKIENYFIEFNSEDIPDSITCHDMKYVKSSPKLSAFNRRLTAFGCQNGWMSVFMIDSTKNVVLKSWTYQNDSFISQMHFFTTKSIYDWSKLDIEKTPVNLLVLRALEPPRIINNVVYSNNGYEDFQDLEIQNLEKMHSCYDLVTSAEIYDATFCGMNSIVLGTFGKAVLFYCPTLTSSEEGNEANKPKPCAKNYQYEFNKKILFKHSVMGLCRTSLSNNGAYDLCVLTLNGVSIWQYDPEKLVELINKRFEENEQKYLELIDSKLAAVSLNLNSTQ